MMIHSLLKAMVKQDASDLYLTTDAYATLKVHGKHQHISKEPLRRGAIRKICYEILSDEEIQEFETTRELDKGLSLEGYGRFRLNFYFQRGEVSLVARYIRSQVQTPEELKLPPVLKHLIMKKEGLMLFVGSTGSGKSTSMASLIEYRNQVSADHILTIEDPIEFSFSHARSIIGQREVGTDTLSYANAMRQAMREAPDLIMVGEIRDTETMESALGFADTGHMVISTLHATNVIQALERIVYLFPKEQKHRVLMDLSLNLKGIVAQRLIKSNSGKYLLAAEVLVNTPYVAEIIRNGEFQELKDVIEKGASDGMITFDQCLLRHYQEGSISKEEALENAGSNNNLLWEMNFGESEAKQQNENTEVYSTLPELN